MRSTTLVSLVGDNSEAIVCEAVGLEFPKIDCDGGPRYRGNAWVPTGRWTNVSPSGQSSGVPEDGPWVALFDVPAEVLVALRDSVRHRLQMTSLVRKKLDVLEITPNAAALIRNLTSDAMSIDLGARAFESGWRTVTLGPDGFRTGIHVDSWFGDSISDRETRPNRICINLGPGSREFLFLPTTAPKDLGLFDEPAARASYQIVAAQARVVSVSLRPGQAYIAPTEALAHDGSTHRSRAGSISYTIIGNFKIDRIFDHLKFSPRYSKFY